MTKARTGICSRALLLLFCLACSSTPRPADDPTTDWLAPGTHAGGSSDAILGALGRKRKVGRGEAFFERMTIPSWRELEVYNAGTVTVAEKQVARLKELGLTAETLAAVNAKLGREKISSFKMVLLQIRDPHKLAAEIDSLLGADSGLRTILGQQGIRIITSVGVVFGHEAMAKLEGAAGAKATLTKVATENIEFKIDTETQKSYTVKIADGTIVAYQFARLCWAPDGTLVTLIRDVQKKDACPNGSSEVLSIDPSLRREIIKVSPLIKREGYSRIGGKDCEMDTDPQDKVPVDLTLSITIQEKRKIIVSHKFVTQEYKGNNTRIGGEGLTEAYEAPQGFVIEKLLSPTRLSAAIHHVNRGKNHDWTSWPGDTSPIRNLKYRIDSSHHDDCPIVGFEGYIDLEFMLVKERK